MLNKNLRKTNSSGRLNIPKVLADLAGLAPCSQVALCSYEEYGINTIMLKPIAKSDNCKVLYVTKMDERRRILIPKILLPEGNKEVYFDIYIFNGDLIIEQVEV